MSMCRVVSCVVGRGCLLWPVRSLGITSSLCPASFCTPRPNLPVTPGISWLLTFAFQFPMMKRTSFFLVLVLEGLVGCHAAAKSLQSCPTLCDPRDSSPSGSPIPGILQVRTLEWVAISFSKAWKWKLKVKSVSHVRLCNLMDYISPGSSVHVILQARIFEQRRVHCHSLLQGNFSTQGSTSFSCMSYIGR